jgi:cold shock protein
MPMIGTVQFFDDRRGYGFARAGGCDVFIGRSELRKAGIHALQPGDKLAFETIPDDFGKRRRAINIQILGADNG